MQLPEAKQKFIETWGKLGSEWGINRTMAQVHALLLVTPDALTTEEVMEELSISRGNANMTLRDLMSWGLIEKQHTHHTGEEPCPRMTVFDVGPFVSQTPTQRVTIRRLTKLSRQHNHRSPPGECEGLCYASGYQQSNSI